MVKLGFYVVSVEGKKGLHEYEVVCLRFPKELHELLRCLQHCQLDVKATKKGNTIHIMLIEKELS